MPIHCKNLCLRAKIKAKAYAENVKRCTICEAFFKTEDIRCPCCNEKLRVNSRWYRKPKYYY